jgi:hypothetical protein
MLQQSHISSIPTSMHEGFNVQDLPPRASTVSEDTLGNIFGGKCQSVGTFCAFTACCPGLICPGHFWERRCRSR